MDSYFGLPVTSLGAIAKSIEPIPSSWLSTQVMFYISEVKQRGSNGHRLESSSTRAKCLYMDRLNPCTKIFNLRVRYFIPQEEPNISPLALAPGSLEDLHIIVLIPLKGLFTIVTGCQVRPKISGHIKKSYELKQPFFGYSALKMFVNYTLKKCTTYKKQVNKKQLFSSCFNLSALSII
ncbi:hypothetical protein FF38_10184 [Lucilia cuprina]|uniref:Uncharacterized protein n=1 Tax=Lucilia cuprina TaxID=7375 RepID=A0A0L0CNY2_LUCCU|nr:hypothetical protein FF38_10184 [Lucilia cuprina]